MVILEQLAHQAFRERLDLQALQAFRETLDPQVRLVLLVKLV